MDQLRSEQLKALEALRTYTPQPPSQLDKYLTMAKIAMFACLGVLFLSGAIFGGMFLLESRKAATAVATLPTVAKETIQAEMKDTRKLVADELDKTRTTLVTVQTNVTKDAVGLSNTVLGTVDRRLESIQKETIPQLAGTVDKRLESIQKETIPQLSGAILAQVDKQLTETNRSVSTLTTAYADIPKVIGARYERDFNPYFDCKTNGLCIQGQTADTLFAVRASSRSTEKTMNALSTDIPKITTNINGIAGNINRITTPHWYDRILGYALNGAVLYRQLNPATQAVTVAVEAISSQK